MQINGEDFKIYDLDTIDSILERVASNLSTLPKYLLFEEKLGSIDDLRESEKNYTVKDFLKIIRKSAEKNNFEKFAENKENLSPDIINTWLAYNTQSNLDPKIFEQYIVDEDSLDKNIRKSFRENIERNIRFLKAKIEEDISLYKKFETVTEDDEWVYTDSSIDKMKITFELVFSDEKTQMTLLEIFNNVILTPMIPYAKCKNYYKIIKDFNVFEEWITLKENDDIIFMVNGKISEENLSVKNYIEVVLSIGKNFTINVSADILTEKGYLSTDEFIERFLTIFETDKASIKNLTETDITGYFFFPQKYFNPYVFSDLVMNDDLFSRLININERTKVTKKEKNFGTYLHIIFEYPSTGRVSASITQKVVNVSEKEMLNQDREIFPHNSHYIRVHFSKVRDISSVKIFEKYLSKLFYFYQEEEEKIIEKYKVFIPEFGAVAEINIPLKRKQTAVQAPKVFIKKFSRNCGPNRIPKNIPEDEVKIYEDKKLEVMKFPRDIPESGKVYDSDGIDQKYYVCINPEFPYPGLQKNKLENKNEYPYLPCCFKTEQLNKKGGYCKTYFEGEKIKEKDKKQQGLIKGDKILNNDVFGDLPKKLQEFFKLIDNEPNYEYKRLGVPRNSSSFISTILTASGLWKESEKLRIKSAQQTRRKLSEKSVLAKQCMYDFTISEISEFLLGNGYMEPRLYVGMLEAYFDRNIFMFNDKKMFLPRFSQGYYRTLRETDCIFIYENWGAESDHADYPQCELIVKWNVKNNSSIKYSFGYGENISQQINRVFGLLNNTYALNIHINEIIFPTFKVIGQQIDSYGKCRRIDINYGNSVLSLITSPIPPIDAKILPDDAKIQFAERKIVEQFYEENKGEILSQSISAGQLREINGILGNTNVYIPSTGQLLNNIQQIYEIHYLDEIESKYQIFNRNKKYARYITEYIFWLFSMYLKDAHDAHDEKTVIISDKILSEFSEKFLTIIDNFKYPKIAKTFIRDGNIFRDGKFIIQSEEMLKRLMYVLKLQTIRDIKSLVDYHKRTTIAQYYIDITDFDVHANQVIIQGNDTLYNWLQEGKLVFELFSEIKSGNTSPYFFRNENIGPNIFLAQNTITYQKAIDTCIIWKKNGYNVGRQIISEEIKNNSNDYRINFFTYENPQKIKKYVIGSVSGKEEICIIGYKVGTTPFFVALLDL